jgi:hypothetical protein
VRLTAPILADCNRGYARCATVRTIDERVVTLVIEAMRAAFHKVCNVLLLKGDVEDPVTEIIVNKIVALAKAGVPGNERVEAGHGLGEIGHPLPIFRTDLFARG